jgi:hypothetical protein
VWNNKILDLTYYLYHATSTTSLVNFYIIAAKTSTQTNGSGIRLHTPLNDNTQNESRPLASASASRASTALSLREEPSQAKQGNSNCHVEEVFGTVIHYISQTCFFRLCTLLSNVRSEYARFNWKKSHIYSFFQSSSSSQSVEPLLSIRCIKDLTLQHFFSLRRNGNHVTFGS